MMRKSPSSRGACNAFNPRMGFLKSSGNRIRRWQSQTRASVPHVLYESILKLVPGELHQLHLHRPPFDWFSITCYLNYLNSSQWCENMSSNTMTRVLNVSNVCLALFMSAPRAVTAHRWSLTCSVLLFLQCAHDMEIIHLPSRASPRSA